MDDDRSSDHKTNVLVVDDNPKNIAAMKNILSDLPITLHTASSGKEALQTVLRHSFAVIYLDIQMPEMDGYEVTRCLTQNKATSRIPIVLVTAIYHDLQNILKGYESGAIDYLTKPINPEVLIAKTKIFIKLFEQQEKLSSLVEQLDQTANFDMLTKLSNRYQFNATFEKLLESSKRYDRKFALLLLDLDNFKTINDTLGHDVGDILLQKVSVRLQESLRASDHIARLGGDEFAVLSELKAPEDAGQIASNLIHTLEPTFEIEKHQLSISVSIGISTYPFSSDTKKGLFKAADIALYRAKEKGKSTFEYYTDTLNMAYIRKTQIEKEIEKSVKSKEILLLYQPRINMKTQKITALEALAHWTHPTLGNISPTEFISIAEENRYINTLGVYLIDLAFNQFQYWQKKYSALSLSINLSTQQLLSLSFLENLKNLTSKYKIDFSRIEFELTESIFKVESELLKKALKAICDLGTKFSIDNFGKGHTSLSQLKSLPIKCIKIDQSFIRDISTDQNDAAVVQAIIALASSLRLKVIAEGVETKEEADFLIANHCAEAQGFYYSRPTSPKKIDELLENKKSL